MRTSYRWSQYAKAGMVFAASTAAFLLAKTTGFLPNLWRWGSDESMELTVGDPAESLLTPMIPDPVVEQTELFSTASATDLSSTPLLSDFQEQSVSPILLNSQFEGVEEQGDETLIDTSVVKAAQRRLLQTCSTVTVQTPIPNQVIDTSQQYSYSLNNVFSSGYEYLSTGSLPSWLSLQYGFTGSFNTQGLARGVALQSHYAFIAADGYGLEVIDINNPAEPVLISNLFLPGYAFAVVIQGSVAAVVMVSPHSLQIVNISDPHQPIVLGSHSLPGFTQSLAWSGNLLCVADASNYLMIFSIANSTTPLVVGSQNLPDSPLAVAMQNSVAYVADSYVGLLLVDISTPETPSVLGYYKVSGGYAYDVAVQNNLAYVAYGTFGLRIVNVTNSSMPMLVTTIPAIGSVQAVMIQGMFVLVGDSVIGVSVWDVSQPTQPTLWGSYKAGLAVSKTVLSESLLIIAYGSSGLQIADLRTGQLIGTPTVGLAGQSWTVTVAAHNSSSVLVTESFQLTVDRLPHPINTRLTDLSIKPGDSPYSQILDTDVLFVDTEGTFLSLMLTLNINNNPTNITAPGFLSLSLNPTISSTISLGGSAQKVAVQGTMAYVANRDIGLQVVSFADPAAPILVASYAVPGALDVVVQNNTAYVVGPAGLQIFSVANPTPMFLGKLGPWGISGLALSGNLLAWVDDWGVQLVDVSNSTAPVKVGQFNTTYHAYDVAWQSPLNNQLLIANDINGLEVWDLTTPSVPVKLGTVSTAGQARSVTSFNRTSAIVGDLYGGVFAVNTVVPSTPQIIGSCLSPLVKAYDVLVQGSVAFVADDDQGLLLVDFSQPTTPRKLGSYETAGFAYGVAVSGGTALVVEAPLLQILDVSKWQLNVQPTIADVGNYALTLTATDIYGGNTAVNFNLRVEGPPQIHGIIPTQYAKIGQAFNYFVPQGFITDPNFDPITFTAVLINNQSLPAWLQFNAISATFTGTSQSIDVGNLTILLSATDNIVGAVNTTFDLLVNEVPSLNQAISSQLANIGLLYQFTLPANTFNNPNGGELNYTAQQSSGLALPAWLKFNTTSRTFTGLPQSTDAGRYSLTIIAVDRYNGQVAVNFILLAELPPKVNQLITSPFAGINTAFIYPIPVNAFIDVNGNSLSYSALQADGDNLPRWLSFNPDTLIFSGTPLLTDKGILTVQVVAEDPNGGQAEQNFNITVTYFPQVAEPINSQLIPTGLNYLWTVPNTTFSDPDNPVLIYSVQWSGHQNLPGWLTWNESSLQLMGQPNQTNTGQYDLVLSATDPYGAAADTAVMLIVDNFPQLNRPLGSQLAGVGLPFSLSIPANTFMDLEDELLTYQVLTASNSSLPNWLSFNSQALILSGVPQVTNLGDLLLQLIVTDPVGGQGRQNFNVSVIYFPTTVAAISNQLAGIDYPYQQIIPRTLFQYQGLDTLAYTLQQSNGDLLPPWLQFNANTLLLQGMPNSTDTGLLTLKVMATNQRGAQANAIFTMQVESFPRVNQWISSQLAGINLPFALTISGNAFEDDDGDVLTYQASQMNNIPLPNWLSFNPYSLIFSGVPQVTDQGKIFLQLKTSDPLGASAQQNFTITVTYFPKLLQTLTAPLADIGALYQWTVSNNTFTSLDGSVLIYSARQQNGLPLPNWLQFNAEILQFLGVPNISAALNYDLVLIAQTAIGAQTMAVFTLQVEHFPQLSRNLSDQWAGVGLAFSFTLPVSVFVDLDNEPLIYQAYGSDHSLLPNWLSFNPVALTFLGVPLEVNLGALPILLIVTDPAGASAQGNFTVSVIHFPVVSSPLSTPSILWSGRLFTWQLPSATFSDPDQLIQSYRVTQSDGAALPTWLQFNADAQVLMGTPQDPDAGTLNLLIIAQGPHQIQAQAMLTLTVAVNLPPQLVIPISDQTAIVGDPFKFFVPTGTFVDPEGSAINYTAVQAGSDALPDWLDFNASSLTFSGIPQGEDTNTYSARTFPIALIAQDSHGQTQTLFNINVLGTSNWAFAIKVSAPLISFFTALIAVYRERALCLNRCNKKHYQRPSQTVTAGTAWQYALSTAPELIHRIEVKLHQPQHGRCRFFRSDQRVLPGNSLLPSWMDYDTNTNTLHSLGPVPVDTPRDLMVNVKGSGGVILEQFKITVIALTEEKESSQLLEASGPTSPVSMDTSRERMLTFS